MKYLLLISIFILTSSCSSYINKMYGEFDKNKESNYRAPKTKNNFDFYRGQKKSSFSERNSKSRKFLSPKVKRSYTKSGVYKKRTRDYDLNDNGGDGSLWIDSSGSANQLFTQESRRKIGDIVVINVFNRLKNEITSELKRAFPSRILRSNSSKKDSKKEGTDTKANETPSDKEAHDKISAIIVEEINKSHILLRGRKNLLFKNRKHLVEVQALISRKTISLDDTVNSNEILESEVNIIR